MSCRPLCTIAAIISFSSMLLGSPTATAQAEENLVDLGAVAPGLGINNSGEVVLQNYIYSAGALTAFPSGFTGAAINASGEVAGTLPNGDAAAVYLNGTVTNIPTPSQTLEQLADFQGVGINDSGQVVVDYFTENTDFIAYSYLYNNGTLSQIPGFGCGGDADVTPAAINDSGQITGSAAVPAGCQYFDGYGYAFLYDANTTVMTNLGIVGGGYAINASGEVTGLAIMPTNSGQGDEGTAAAFLYSNGKVTLLPGTSNAFAPDGTNCTGYGINSSGSIVGTCSGYAFFYNGNTVDLNTLVLSTDPLKPYVTLTDARGINDSGLIIVNGVDSRDKLNHAYLFQVSSGSSGSSSAGGSKGGGIFDLFSLSFLIGMLALRRKRRATAGVPVKLPGPEKLRARVR
jgi:hypothetical protein